MNTRYLVIANLHAGSGKAKKVILTLENVFHSKAIPYTIFQTEFHNHGSELVQMIAKQFDPKEDRLLVVGGDGTLHEVVSGLKRFNLDIPIGFIPAGTGNDFARSVAISNNSKKIIQNIIAATEPRVIEAFLYQDKHLVLQGVGLNSLGFGFDGQVIGILDDKTTKKKGFSALKMDSLVYLATISGAFKKRKSFSARITVDGKTKTFDNILIVAAMNHPYFGGGVKIDPESRSNSNELAAMVITDITLKALLQLLPKVLITGKHIHSPHFTRISGRKLAIELSEPVVGQADGELLDAETYNMQFELTTFKIWN